MSTSPHLKMTLLTVGQATPETTVNNALVRLEDATQRALAVAISGAGVTLTADQFTTYNYFICTGTGGGTPALTVPLTVDGNSTPINRMFLVGNVNAGTLTIKGSSGTTITTVTGEIAACYCDGVNVYKLLSTSVLATFTANQNIISSAGGALSTEAPIYDIGTFFGGKPTVSGGLMSRFVMGRNVSLASGAVGWQAYCGTAITTSGTIDIRKNNSSVGSIVFATGSNVGAFTFASAVSFSAGDRLEFYAPAVQDATLADISIFIKATRTLP